MLQSLLPGNAPLLEQLARFTELRQNLLAGNIANIDTPGYQPRDLPVSDFQRALHAAYSRTREGTSAMPASSSSAIAPMPGDSESLFRPRYRGEGNFQSHDESRRSIEDEISALTKNAIVHQYAVELLTNSYRLLETAIGPQR